MSESGTVSRYQIPVMVTMIDKSGGLFGIEFCDREGYFEHPIAKFDEFVKTKTLTKVGETEECTKVLEKFSALFDIVADFKGILSERSGISLGMAKKRLNIVYHPDKQPADLTDEQKEKNKMKLIMLKEKSVAKTLEQMAMLEQAYNDKYKKPEEEEPIIDATSDETPRKPESHRRPFNPPARLELYPVYSQSSGGLKNAVMLVHKQKILISVEYPGGKFEPRDSFVSLIRYCDGKNTLKLIFKENYDTIKEPFESDVSQHPLCNPDSLFLRIHVKLRRLVLKKNLLLNSLTYIGFFLDLQDLKVNGRML